MPPVTPPTPGPMVGRQLGRLPATDAMRKKTLPLRHFVRLVGRPVPATDDYATLASAALRTMMGNDTQGDCVAADLCKRVGMMNAYRPGGKVLVATTAEALAFYHQVGGPGDNGLYMPDAYDYWRDKGIKIGGVVHKIEGYASFDVTDSALFDAACHWFQGVDLGVALTRTQYMHAEDTDTWDIDGSPVVGGHAIPLTQRGVDRCKIATWAREPGITRRLLHSRTWCDEAYVVISKEMMGTGGLDVNNVNWDALAAAMKAIASGGTPDIPPDPNPPTPPAPPTPPTPAGGTWTGSGNLDFLGTKMPIALAGVVSGSLTTAGANLWTILADLAAVAVAFRARDWVAVAAAVQQLLADLGTTLTDQEFASLMNALQVERETRVLVDGRK